MFTCFRITVGFCLELKRHSSTFGSQKFPLPRTVP